MPVKKKTRGIFDFLNSTSEEIAAEVVRRNKKNGQVKFSKARTAAPEVCPICTEQVENGDKYLPATTRKYVHEACIRSAAPSELKLGSAPLLNGRKEKESKTREPKEDKPIMEKLSAEKHREVTDIEMNFRMGYLTGRNEAHKEWMDKLPELLGFKIPSLES